MKSSIIKRFDNLLTPTCSGTFIILFINGKTTSWRNNCPANFINDIFVIDIFYKAGLTGFCLLLPEKNKKNFLSRQEKKKLA